jgi:lipoprotein NlpI
MSKSAIAVILIFAVAFLVVGIEIAHQRMTTGVVDMKAARRWFYRTVGAALVQLAGLAIFDVANFGRSRGALFDAQAGTEAAQRHDPDMAITLYSKAIEAGTLPSETEADVFDARGMARLQKKDWNGGIADFNEALKRKADNAEAHFGLGVAYSSQGNDDAALQEFGRIIEQGGDAGDMLADAYEARGETYLTLGQYQRGIQDFDEALRRESKDASAHGGRGDAYFYLGQFDKAELDFNAAVTVDTKMPYYPLWLYLAQAHQDKDGKADLERDATGVDLKTWPGPVIEFYRGKMSPDDLLAAARTGDAKTQRDQQCEADFYLGEHALFAGNKDEARRLLGEAADNCDRRFIEYAGAKTELARIAP